MTLASAPERYTAPPWAAAWLRMVPPVKDSTMARVWAPTALMVATAPPPLTAVLLSNRQLAHVKLESRKVTTSMDWHPSVTATAPPNDV